MRLVISIINFCRNHLSPFGLPRCRFVPTCSQYAVEALQEMGPVKGSLKIIWRLLRCQPFARPGYDPLHKEG